MTVTIFVLPCEEKVRPQTESTLQMMLDVGLLVILEIE